ncbi:MAG: hypothetical protein AB7K67_09505 [Hyphomicrobiaceae bacterium]
MRFGSELAFQVDLAAAAIAVLALVFSFRATKRQAHLERETLRQQRDSDVINWSNDCLDALCHAEMMMRPEYVRATVSSEYEKGKLACLAQISCCIDRGRLFFPNNQDGRFGLNKEAAFQGHRHPVLDALVGVYDLLSKTAHETSVNEVERQKIRDFSVGLKRDFISRVQADVDPRRRLQFIKSHK